MFFIRNKSRKSDLDEYNEISEDFKDTQDIPPFKSFEDTYKWVLFGLVVNMMYPREQNSRKQTWLTGVTIATILSAVILCLYSMVISAKQGDLNNTTRQLSIIIPCTAMIVKVVVSKIKEELFRSTIDEINSDYLEANEMKNPDYMKILKSAVRNGKIAQIVWICNSIAVAGGFPFFAMVDMVKHNWGKNESKKIMVHELILPVFNNYAHDMPVFEIVFIYSLIIVFFCMTNYVGFDANFCVVVSHCRGQLQLMTKRLKNLFSEEGMDSELLKIGLRNCIRHHQKIFKFSDTIQEMYGVYMSFIVIMTSLQICITVFQLTEALAAKEVNIQFMIFTFGTILQVYLPCTYAGLLTYASSQSAVDIYCCGWENVNDPLVRSTLRIMIARAQKPITLTAAYLMLMNMETFTSIINTSYSFFTLLRSGD